MINFYDALNTTRKENDFVIPIFDANEEVHLGIVEVSEDKKYNAIKLGCKILNTKFKDKNYNIYINLLKPGETLTKLTELSKQDTSDGKSAKSKLAVLGEFYCTFWTAEQFANAPKQPDETPFFELSTLVGKSFKGTASKPYNHKNGKTYQNIRGWTIISGT